jgi:hypothetical protein
MKRSRFLIVALLLVGAQACGPTDESAHHDSADLCAQANAKLSECFPDQPAGDGCHGATAQLILDQSCEDLASVDAKADGSWMCFWNPWLCRSGSSQPQTYTLMVGTSRCGAGLLGDNDCTYYYSSSCTAVALYRDGIEVARDHSSLHGSVRFELDEPGDYEVHVLDRQDAVATQLEGLVSYQRTPAIKAVSIGNSGEARVNFDLPHDSEEAVKRCAPVRIDLSVETAAGNAISAQDVEWQWFVRFLQDDGTVGLTRPFAIHPDASGEADYVNRAYFSQVYAGVHMVEFVRMNIPEWARRNNPDYQALLERYAVRSVPPLAERYTLADANIPAGDRLDVVLVDPLTE